MPILTFLKRSWRLWLPENMRMVGRQLPSLQERVRVRVPKGEDLLEDSMRVLGIDPGSLITGFGVVEEARGGLCALAWGTVRTSSNQPLPVRLQRIYDGLAEALRQWEPEAVPVEAGLLTTKPLAILGLGHSRGVTRLPVAAGVLPL